MSSLEVKPMQEKHIEDASCLFVSQYTKLQKEIPCLPSKYCDKNNIFHFLSELCCKSPGVVAIKGDKLVGYLTGMKVPSFKGSQQGIYCPEWAHSAVFDDCDEIYSRMYGSIASIWVDNGCFNHAVTLLSNNKSAMESWFWNGFGLHVVDLVRSLEAMEANNLNVEGLVLRKATEDDTDSLLQIFHEHNRYYSQAPIFLPFLSIENRASIHDLIIDSSVTVWIAEVKGEIVAFMRSKVQHSDCCMIVQDKGTIGIFGAYVKEEWRKYGIGKLLLRNILNSAREDGLERCSVVFESFNPNARNFWLKYFEPVCYSVVRHVDDRVGWANKDRDLNNFWCGYK